MTDITVISVLHQDYGTFDCMVHTTLSSSTNVKKILVCNNGDNPAIVENYKNHSSVVFIDGVDNSSDISTHHARGLNKLLTMVETPLVAIIEPDVMILNRGWDDLSEKIDLRACLKGGTPYYYPCFMVGRTEKINKIDFTPAGRYENINGIEIYPDTGWRISNAGLSIEQLEHKSCVAGDCAIIPNKIFKKRTNEFWLKDKPIAAHLWRGSRPTGMGGDYDNYLKVWKDTSEKILKNLGKE